VDPLKEQPEPRLHFTAVTGQDPSDRIFASLILPSKDLATLVGYKRPFPSDADLSNLNQRWLLCLNKLVNGLIQRWSFGVWNVHFDCIRWAAKQIPTLGAFPNPIDRADTHCVIKSAQNRNPPGDDSGSWREFAYYNVNLIPGPFQGPVIIGDNRRCDEFRQPLRFTFIESNEGNPGGRESLMDLHVHTPKDLTQGACAQHAC
jgi:hypothetical protein